MKSILQIILFLLFSFYSLSQTTYTVIDGTKNSESYYLVKYDYAYSYTQQIYPKEKINAPSGDIKSLFFEYCGTSPVSLKVKIYLKLVSKISMTSNMDWEAISAMTLVYDGTISPSSSGWYEVVLPTSFKYDNTNNLMLTVYTEVPGSSQSSYNTANVFCYESSQQNNASLSLASSLNYGSSDISLQGYNQPKLPSLKLKIQTCTQPTTQASATGLTVDKATKNSLSVNWKNGNGDKVLVVATPTGTTPVAPAVGTAYNANSAYGSGQTTAANNYVVYNGTGTNVDVTGLSPITTYDFYVYSYNTTGNCYLTTSPYKFSGTTLDVCNSPLAAATFINFPDRTKTSISVNWTNGSGDKVLVVARKATDLAVKPTFSTAYNANSVFGTGQITGSGNFVVYNGTGTNVTVTGLTESTSYFFDVYTYNSADNCYKGLLTVGSNSKSISTKSDFYNIKDLDGQTITTCDGKVVDGGGVSGNYSSGNKQTLTISPESPTDGSCLTFTQWELEGASDITFYDGNVKIYRATNTWNQNNNEAPLFKGPGTVCASPGQSLKIEFDPNGTAAGFTAEISCYSPPKACEINVSSIRTGICKGESLELTADGFIGASLLNNDFNTKTLGSDWSTLINPRFDNPCNAGLDGTYFWTSTDPKPRDLTSKGLDVSQGGSISFDFRMAAQAGNQEVPGGSKDCEGSEKIEEGIFLEYSTDGTTWKQIHYFFPSQATLGLSNSFNETTSWQRYYFEIPKAAQTKNTKFRWIQYEIDDDINDVWGMDRINVTAISPFKIIWKDITNNQTVGTSNLNESPYKVTVKPTVTTIYEAQLVDAVSGKILCSKQITISVSDFDVTPTPESTCGASDGKIEFTTTGAGINYSINNGLSFTSNPLFTNIKGGTYDVVFQNPTCTATKKVTINSKLGGPPVDAVSDKKQCVGTTLPTITFTPLDATVTYNWTNDNTSTGIAATGTTAINSLTLLNTGTTPLVSNIEVVPVKNGCTGEPKKFKITVDPKDDANFIVTDYCDGSSGTVTISGVSGGSFTSLPAGLTANSTSVSGGTGGQSYELTYTTPNCVNTSKQTVKVNAPISATFDYSDFCETSTGISGGGATNILKTGGTFSFGSIVSNGETIDATSGSILKNKGGISYTITYTPPTGSCYTQTQKTIKVKAIEQITFVMDDICFGTTGKVKTISPSGGKYNFVNPPSDPAATKIDVNTGDLTGAKLNESYDLSYQSLGSANECPNTKFITVKTIKIPTINIQPIDDQKCDGNKVRFFVKATDALSYQWEEKSTVAGATFTPIVYDATYQKGVGGKEDTLVISSNTGKENFEYRVILGEAASNSVCPVTSTSAKILFKSKTPAPTFNCDNTLRKIDQVGFDWEDVNTATKYDLKYEYTDPSNSTLKSGTFNDILVSNYTLNGLPKNTDIKLSITPKGINCYTSFNFTCKTLDCIAPIINTQTTNATVCEDAIETTFYVTATANISTNPLSYKWFVSSDNGINFNPVNSTIYSNTTTSSLKITPSITTKFKDIKNNQYKVEIEENGCISNSVAKLIVNELPSFVPTATSQCFNDPLYVKANFTNPKKVEWTGPSFTKTDVNDLKIEVVAKSTSLNNGNYSVTVTDQNNCINTKTIVVNINPLPTVNAGLDQEICVGSSTKLVASGANSYLWDNNITNNVSFTPTSNLNYTVTGTDLNGCKNTDVVEIKLNPLPVLNPTSNSPCEQDELTLDAGFSGATSYNWIGPNGFTESIEKPKISTVTLNAKGKYTVTVTDNKNCSKVVDIQVNINPIDNIQFTDLTATCKNGAIFNLPSVNILGGTWSSDDNVSIQNPYTGVFDPGKSMPDQTYKVVVTYSTKTITPARLCPATLSKVIYVYPTPDTTFIVREKNFCITDTLFAEVVNPNTGTTYTWEFNNGVTKNGISVEYQYPKSGIYDLSLTAKQGICTNTSLRKQHIKVVNFPENVEFTQSDTKIDFYNPEIQFKTNTNASYYLWNFGDGTTSTYKNPNHKFPEIPGEYIIDLTVSNMLNKCGITVSRSIFLPEPVIYFIPNTFTPNGDEINNTFQPVFTYGYDPQNYSFYIYNRWGELIFESHDSKIGWDGTFGNELVHNDTYVWKLEFKEKLEETKHVKTGHVTLLK